MIGWLVSLVCLYAVIELPFANGAVAISFWIVFFSGLRLGRRHDAEAMAGTRR